MFGELEKEESAGAVSQQARLGAGAARPSRPESVRTWLEQRGMRKGDTIALFMIKPSELLRVMAGLVPHRSRQAALT